MQFKAGDSFEIRQDGANVLLVPKRRRKFRTWIGKSPITGMAVLMTEPGAPRITKEMVDKLLEDFP